MQLSAKFAEERQTWQDYVGYGAEISKKRRAGAKAFTITMLQLHSFCAFCVNSFVASALKNTLG